MRVVPLAGVWCVLLVWGGCQSSPQRDVAANADGPGKAIAVKYRDAIARVLPAGWSVSAPDDGTILIQRAKDATYFFAPPSSGGGVDLQSVHKPKLALKVMPPVSRTALAKLQKMNEDRAEAIRMLQAELKDVRSVKGTYLPMNAEQQKRVDAYEFAVQQLQWNEIPDLFAVDAAFVWTRPEAIPAYNMLLDTAVADEVDRVRDAVGGQFSTEPTN